MGEQSNRINPSSRQEYERGNFSCTITKNAKEKNEWDDPKEAHPGRLAVPAPGTAQTGTDGAGGGVSQAVAYTRSAAGPRPQNMLGNFKRAFELRLGVKQSEQGDSTAREGNTLPTEEGSTLVLFAFP